MTKSQMKSKWIKMVENYIWAYPNIKRASTHYEKLLQFAQDNNLDFKANLEGAIKYLKDKKAANMSFLHALAAFEMR